MLKKTNSVFFMNAIIASMEDKSTTHILKLDYIRTFKELKIDK
jgi:sulfur relay (sulfurtransferase) DsrF/TusC family protein